MQANCTWASLAHFNRRASKLEETIRQQISGPRGGHRLQLWSCWFSGEMSIKSDTAKSMANLYW